MSRTIKKTSVFLALLMAALMVLTLLPLTVKADDNRPPEDTDTQLETITVSQADLIAATANPGTATAKHITYRAAEIGGFNSFAFTGSYAFELAGDLEIGVNTLLAFGTNEGGSQILDLNGYSIISENPLEGDFDPTEDDPIDVIYTGMPVVWSLNIGEGTFTVTDSAGGGSIVTADDDDGYALIASGNTNIDEGIFDGKVDIYGDSNIYSGTFTKSVKITGEAEISGGEFRQILETCSNAHIVDGIFYCYCADSDGLSGDEAAVVWIEDGIFESDYDCAAIFEDVDVTINGGEFSGTEDADGVRFFAYGKGGLLVDGGSFSSVNFDAMYVNTDQLVDIIGGTFIGGENGLNFEPYDDTANLSLAGGTYAGTLGAIKLYDYKGTASAEDIFNYVLAADHKYDPALEATRDGDIVKTQEMIRILPETAEDMNITDNTEDQDVAAQVGKMIEKLVAGEEVPGISKELADALLTAIANNDKIKVDLMPIEVSADFLTDEEWALINGAMGDNQKVLTLYNVWIAVSISGDDEDYFITQLPEEILLAFELPDGLPAVAEGYTRNFTVFRIHDGAISALPGKLNADKNWVETNSNLFSIYALAYEDVANVTPTPGGNTTPDAGGSTTPTTGDNSGLTAFITIGIISAAAITVVGINKKFKEDN